MIDVNKFIEGILAPNVDYEHYMNKHSARFKRILGDNKLLHQLASRLSKEIDFLTDQNFGAVLGLLRDIFEVEEVILPDLYPDILRMMYKSYNLNASIPYKYVDLMLKIKPSKTDVFQDVVRSTSQDIPENVCISLLALYSPLGNFSDLPRELVEELVEKTFKCFIKNKEHSYLRNAIKYNLYPCIKNTQYSEYYERFISEGLENN